MREEIAISTVSKFQESRTNEGWLAALRGEDAQALEELRVYLCRSLNKALAAKPVAQDVEDFAQQAMPRILGSLDQFRGDSRFTTWASAIAVRVALTELRRKRWSEVSLDAMLETGSTQEAAAPPEGVMQTARAELYTVLREAIAEALTERQRAVVLAELNGVSSTVLSERLGMTRGALYKMHHDARKRLREYLMDRGYGVDDLRYATDGAAHAR